MIPERIGEPDRTWLALAAYNIGYGHLEDARVLTQMRNHNPDSWQDVRAQLPLLAQENWYTRVKRGYARGWEPVRFVDNVRAYLDVLEWVARDVDDRDGAPPDPSLAASGTSGRCSPRVDCGARRRNRAASIRIVPSTPASTSSR